MAGKVCIVCNDEGLINGMPMNRTVERYGALAGPFSSAGSAGKLLQSDGRTGAEIPADVSAPSDLLHTERGVGYLEYDNVTLPGAPQEAIDRFKKRNGLPEFCCCLCQYGDAGPCPLRRAFVCSAGSTGAGRKGGRNCRPSERAVGRHKAAAGGNALGQYVRLGHSAADPARYDEQGMPKRHGPKT